MAGWFSSATQFLDDTFDSVVAKVSEAQSELETEQAKFADSVAAEGVGNAAAARAGKAGAGANGTDGALLPWETKQEDLEILSNDAMERVLQLSVTEENFTVPPSQAAMRAMPTPDDAEDDASSSASASLLGGFDFGAFVPTALRLLQLDPNLASTHAKLMPRMEEEVFWRHYYYRLQYIRASVGLEGEAAKAGPLGSLAQEQFRVFEPTHVAAPVARSSASNLSSLAGSASACASAAAENAKAVKAVERTEEELEAAAEKRRRTEEAALAAEVEAELLGEDDDLELELDLDLSDLGSLDDADLDDGDLLEELEAELASPPPKEPKEKGPAANANASANASTGANANANASASASANANTSANTPTGASAGASPGAGLDGGDGDADADDIDADLGGLSMAELDAAIESELLSPPKKAAAD